MKKILAFMLASLMLLSSTGCSAKNEATNETANNGTAIEIDGQAKSLIAYNINNNNYFKLRDIANVLKDTDAKFDVIWNEEKQAIELISDTSYSTNEEISTEKIEGATPVRAFPVIYLDGAEILLTAYNIANNNYFKLRDLASAIDFGVNYDAERGIIVVDTKTEYVFPESSGTEFAINPKYLSLIGKTKAYIDKKFGNEGEWWPEYNGIYYENVGVNIYYDTVMLEEPTSSSIAKGIDLHLNYLFFNCPAKPTAGQIQALFPASHIGFAPVNNGDILNTNYNGKDLDFGLVSNLSSDSIAILTGNPYPYEMTETPKASENALYTAILDDYYNVIVSGNGYYNEGMTGLAEAIMEENDDLNSIGYTIRDLSGDGVPELVIGWTHSYSGGDSVLALYTIKSGTPAFVFEGWIKNDYELNTDGTFYHHENYGGEGTFVGKYKLSQDGTQLNCVDCTFVKVNMDSGDVNYYRNSTGNFYDTASQKISEAQYSELEQTLSSNTTDLDLTPFSQYK